MLILDSFVILSIGFGLPIFLTLLNHLPFVTTLFDKLSPYLVYPSLIGTYHIRPLPWLLGNAPTVGQALYIFLFFLLNLVLSSVNYSRSQPHPWWFPPKEELLSYIGYRTGHIGYALLPLLILFSGRNNFLLWVTNWPYSTYLLLHRWVARIFAVHAIIHSIVLLITYKGTGDYATASKEPYWLWGIVATVLTCAMLIFSQLYFRRLAYEFFLILHVILAVLVIVGCWYHVRLRFGFQFYSNWLFAACAVWFFDRLVRFIRVAKNGARSAVITEVGSEHVRVDIPDVRWANKPGYVIYVYFPTLNPFKPWENHPFSLNSTVVFNTYQHALVSATPDVSEKATSHKSSSDEARDIEKSAVSDTTNNKGSSHSSVIDRTSSKTSGITFVIKRNAGLTKKLRANAQILTLLDGPYPQHSPSASLLASDHLLLIGGGIGITGLLSFAHSHPNVKLAWSVKVSAASLVKELEIPLAGLRDKTISIGERLDIDGLLRDEQIKGYGKVAVVVCGPGGMCDAVRAQVAGLARAGGSTVWELEVLAFSW